MPGSGAAVEVLRVLFRTGLNPGGGDSGQNRRRSGRGTRSPRRTPPSATGSTPSGTPMPGSSMSTASIPNEQTLSGLRLIPDGALPPSPHPARASPRWNTQTLLSGIAHLARASPRWNTQTLLSGIPHLARASGAPPPPPPGGEGSHGDTQGKAVSVLLWDLPMEWTVGVSPRGGGDRGGGDPLPAGGYPYVPPQSPQREQYVTIPGKSRLPGCNPPDSVKKDRYSPPLGVPVIENRCTTRSPGMPSRDSRDAVGGVAGVDMGRMYRSTAGVLR